MVDVVSIVGKLVHCDVGMCGRLVSLIGKSSLVVLVGLICLCM